MPTPRSYFAQRTMAARKQVGMRVAPPYVAGVKDNICPYAVQVALATTHIGPQRALANAATTRNAADGLGWLAR